MTDPLSVTAGIIAVAGGEKFETPKQWIRLGTVGFSPRRDGRYNSFGRLIYRIVLVN
jgi:hypothetical protein